nr:hypothetical protein Q903MT_gene2143 [Picea sitchensis]
MNRLRGTTIRPGMARHGWESFFLLDRTRKGGATDGMDGMEGMESPDML